MLLSQSEQFLTDFLHYVNISDGCMQVLQHEHVPYMATQHAECYEQTRSEGSWGCCKTKICQNVVTIFCPGQIVVLGDKIS